jgi:outer membrane protein OmpA-like peptidoglycan-associated protein
MMSSNQSKKVAFLALTGLGFLAGCADLPREEYVKVQVPVYNGSGERMRVLDREGLEMPVYIMQKRPVVAEIEPTPAPAIPVVMTVKFDSPHRFDFPHDSSTLTSEQAGELEALVPTLENTDTHVIVEGYTDPIGTEAYNYGLGLRRAASVKDYLVSKGVAASRIDTKSFGETSDPERKAVLKPMTITSE